MSLNTDHFIRPDHEYKPTKLIAGEPKQTWLGKHVEWLKEERHGWSRLGVMSCAILEQFALAISVVGWIPLVRGWREAKHQEARAAFFHQAEQITPPSDDAIELKSPTRTFNHVHDFAIENGIIWTRERQGDARTWRPVYFDGFAEGNKPQSIDCDGANLIVLDEQNTVHYKKVLREYRHTEVQGENRSQFEEKGVDLDNDPYIAIDKSDRDNWKDKWFSLPYVHHLINLFTGKRLRLPEAKAWAISQRGRYNDYLEDHVHQKHPVEAGVTTLYVLDRNGKDIYKYDPWSPKYVKISIPMPEDSHKSFEAENMSVSASTIMAIGYEVEKDHPEKRQLKIYTRLADIDSEGWNPGLKYDYFQDAKDSDVRVLPLPQWEAHPLSLEGDDFVTKTITIVQLGEGNGARELRVEGQKEGERGFYFKKINESDWHFEAVTSPAEEIKEETILPLEQESIQPFETTVYNYNSKNINIRGMDGKQVTGRLEDFGKRSYRSKLVVRIDNQEYQLDLYKKKTLKNFIGFEGDAYEVVIPEEYHEDEQLMAALQGRKVIPVTVFEDQGQVKIHSQPASLFTGVFARE